MSETPASKQQEVCFDCFGLRPGGQFSARGKFRSNGKFGSGKACGRFSGERPDQEGVFSNNHGKYGFKFRNRSGKVQREGVGQS